MSINANQRFGLLTTLAAALLVLLLHFPFDGYENEYSYTVPSFTRCPEGNIETMRAMGAEKYNDAVAACQDKNATQNLPFTNWRSNGALNPWLAAPVHAMVALLSILVVGGLWFFAVRSPREIGQKNS